MSPLTKILIMDDDPDHLLFCTLVFQRRGYEVMSLRGCNREEFLQHVAAFGPGLIFLDHQMQGLSGPAAVEALKSNPEYAHICVVYFSAEPNVTVLAREAGADAHLKKPFTIQRLLDLTNQLLHNSGE